jgi:hypothetical protein
MGVQSARQQLGDLEQEGKPLGGAPRPVLDHPRLTLTDHGVRSGYSNTNIGVPAPSTMNESGAVGMRVLVLRDARLLDEVDPWAMMFLRRTST